MAFYQDFISNTVMAWGLDAMKPSKAESRNHAFYAYDLNRLYFPDNNLNWVFIGSTYIVGPGSSVNNTIARFDGTTGLLVQGSGIVIDDNDDVGIGISSPAAHLHIDNISDKVGLIVQGHSTQTSNIIEIKNDSSEVLVAVGGSGTFKTLKGRIESAEESTGTDTVDDEVEQHYCNSGSPYTLTLPINILGKKVAIINKGAGTVTLSPASGNIGGSSSETLVQYAVRTIRGDGTNWF